MGFGELPPDIYRQGNQVGTFSEKRPQKNQALKFSPASIRYTAPKQFNVATPSAGTPFYLPENLDRKYLFIANYDILGNGILLVTFDAPLVGQINPTTIPIPAIQIDAGGYYESSFTCPVNAIYISGFFTNNAGNGTTIVGPTNINLSTVYGIAVEGF